MLFYKSLCLLATLQPVFSASMLNYSAARGDDQSILGQLNLEAARGDKVSANRADLYIKPGTDAKGVKALHFHRNVGDIRAEYHALSKKIDVDQTYYIGYKLSLGVIEESLMIWQFKAYTDNNAEDNGANIPLSLEIKSGKLHFQYQADYSAHRVSQWSQTVTANTVYSFGIVINTSRPGWAELYFNGKKQTFSTTGTTRLNGNTFVGRNEPKFGIYRGEAVAINNYVYNVQVGTALSDISEASGISSSGSSSGSCSWSGHCAGATCSTDDDCSDSLVCTSGVCSSDSSTCDWVGHCAGATCTTYNDCSGDLVCKNA
ncbi:hypothetical protein ARAM_007363, partial [Aspergillus rambellii]